MSATTVTQAQWIEVMGSDPSLLKGDPRRPVDSVSWEQSGILCDRIARGSGRLVRLPTELEWEHACRAGSTTAYSFGADAAMLVDHAWFKANSGGTTHPVATRMPNAWGLHDMHGNVWEWCSDAFVEDEHAIQSDHRRPPEFMIGRLDCTRRVLRGGSWLSVAERCRCDYRGRFHPRLEHCAIGVRLVVEA